MVPPSPFDDDAESAPEGLVQMVQSLLEKHPGEVFEATELAGSKGVTRTGITHVLARLEDRGRVDRTPDGWRSSDHDRSLDATLAHTAAAAASYEDRPFHYDAWQEYAVDPRNDRQ